MLYKKKSLDTNFATRLTNIFKKIIFGIGLVSFLFLGLVVYYYYSSGLQKTYSPKQIVIEVNDKVLKRYVGLDMRNTFQYLKILNLNIINNFTSNNLENVYLEISQESIFGLELQRKLRSENGGELTDEEKIFYPARLNLNNEKYNIKLRTKGVRALHWKKKDETSYKIDLRGSKRIWGMEEFAFQKPITRNYSYEYLFHNLLGHVGLLKIKYFFVNLYLNDQNLGVYAVEESFSKELIERQGKRNGPIFSLKDELGEYFPNVKFELYSNEFWFNENQNLIKNLFSILNNFKKKDFSTFNHFDQDKWAKYFAIMDLTGSYHGSLLKSVKLYYNPTTALFEPIGFDLHKNEGLFNNFILMDFLTENTSSVGVDCSYICDHKSWYLKFLKENDGRLSDDFIKKYIKYLKIYSDNKFLKDFLKVYSDELAIINNAIYKDNSKTDKITRSGAGFFVFDNDYLSQRAELIRNRINSGNLIGLNISYSNEQLKLEEYKSIPSMPLIAETIECQDDKDNKNFFLMGKTTLNLKTSCKKIKITSSSNQTKIFELKENIEMTEGKDIDFKKGFQNLSTDKGVVKIDDKTFLIKTPLNIYNNTIINKDEKFTFEKNVSINITNNATLFVEGEVDFINDEKNLTQIFSKDGTGSLIFIGNSYRFKNITFSNLSRPDLINFIFYGGVNFIDSNINLENILVKQSKNEDGINIINSNSKISNIYFENIFADAFDVDFGKLNFDTIDCKNVRNDCLDVSGAEVTGKNLLSQNTQDKAVSVGENSRVNISNLKTESNNIGLAVKDGSFANIENVNFENNSIDIVLFNKKQEFSKPSLVVRSLNKLNKDKILQSEGTKLNINNQNFFGNLKDDFINSRIY